MDFVQQANYLPAVLEYMENDQQIIRDASKKRAVDREAERTRKAKVAKEKAGEKRREALLQCAGLMEEVS